MQFLDFPTVRIPPENGIDVVIGHDGVVGEQSPVKRLLVPRRRPNFSYVHDVESERHAFVRKGFRRIDYDGCRSNAYAGLPCMAVWAFAQTERDCAPEFSFRSHIAQASASLRRASKDKPVGVGGADGKPPARVSKRLQCPKSGTFSINLKPSLGADLREGRCGLSDRVHPMTGLLVFQRPVLAVRALLSPRTCPPLLIEHPHRNTSPDTAYPWTTLRPLAPLFVEPTAPKSFVRR